jgi:hypothetical protein
MPKSEDSMRALATRSSSSAKPIVSNAGVVSVELAAGLAVCAARQIEQEAFSLWLG